MCRGVSNPALHWHCAVSKPGTFQSCKNFPSPIFLVLAWTSKALSAFQRFLWSKSTCAVGAGSCPTQPPPRSAPGQSRQLSCVPHALIQRSVQSRATSNFSLWSHCPISFLIYFLVHSRLAMLSVVFAGLFRVLRTRKRLRSLFQTAMHVFQITFLIPELSIQAWYLAMRLLSQRFISGTYASVSSLCVDVALNTPRTARKPLFCSACSLTARPFGFLLTLVSQCYAGALYTIASQTTA